jgi:hypothetical protein
LRELLVDLGFNKNKLYFITAPKGKGDAKNWILSPSQYPSEVRGLRKVRKQRVFLIAALDGDNANPSIRKGELDHSLRNEGLEARQPNERIATPIPTWSIETWLLVLLGEANVDESVSRKQDFMRRYSEKGERAVLRAAAQAWRARADQFPSVPSLADSKVELDRIDS